MIWLRRILIIPLIVLFVLTFVSLLQATHLSDNLGESGFYKDRLRQADIYNWVYDDFAPVALDEAEENQGAGLPIPLHVIKDDLLAVTKETLPPEWLQEKAESGIDEVVPYLVGDTDSLAVPVQLRDRIDVLAPAVVEVAGKPEIYDYLMYELVSRQILNNIGQAVVLPFEVTISHGEVLSAIIQVLPPSWVQERLSDIVYELADYLKGDVDRVDIVVGLTESKAAALDRITLLADQRLRAAFDALPQCSLADFEQDLPNLAPGSLPDCRPTGLDYEGFKTTLGIDVASSVDQYIGENIPDSWIYSDEQLRQSVGEDNAALLDEARELTANGDTLTEADLRDFISDNGNDSTLRSFDDTRHRIHNVRTWLWALWLIPVLLLVGIAFLGGRSWRTRLIWALAVLLLTCLVVFIAVAVVQSRVIDEHARTLVGDPVELQGAELAMTEKGNEIAYDSVSSLATGLQNKALYIVIGSGVVLLGIIVWMVVEWRRNRRLPTNRHSSPTGI